MHELTGNVMFQRDYGSEERIRHPCFEFRCMAHRHGSCPSFRGINTDLAEPNMDKDPREQI